MSTFQKDKQYFKFCAYGFLKNLRLYDAFLLIFFLENGITFSQIGVLYAAREIVINVAEIPSGIIADTYGRKSSLLGAFLLYIMAFVAFYFSHHFYWLLLAMAFIGIGDAFRSGTHKGMIMDYLRMNGWEAHKVAYYGHTRSWSQRGSAISALVAGIMVFYSGNYRIVYLIAILPYLLNFINIYTYPDAINYASKKKAKTRETFKSVLQNFAAAIQKKRVLGIMNSAALHSAYLKSIKDYVQPIMVNLALVIPILATIDAKRKSGLVIGICYFIIYLLTSQASQNAYKLVDLKIKNVEMLTLLSGLVAGIIGGWLFYLEYWLFSLLFLVAIYIIENLRKPILTGVLADNVPNEILTSVISAQSFYQTVVTALIALSVGVLADYGGVGVALVVVSVFLFLMTVGLGRRRG